MKYERQFYEFKECIDCVNKDSSICNSCCQDRPSNYTEEEAKE